MSDWIERAARGIASARMFKYGPLMKTEQITKIIARHAPDYDALKAENEKLEENMWAWSRGLKGQKAYSTKELQEMFQPYVENGDVTGLSPREARLLETLIETGAKIHILMAAIAGLEKAVDAESKAIRETYTTMCNSDFPDDFIADIEGHADNLNQALADLREAKKEK